LGKYVDLLLYVLAGKSDANIPFSDIRRLLVVLGFHERINGGQAKDACHPVMCRPVKRH